MTAPHCPAPSTQLQLCCEAFPFPSHLQATSNDIASKVEEAERTEQEIDAAREQYRPVAVRASLLFFCIADLAGVDSMYQYSLAWFVALFLRTVQATPEVHKFDNALAVSGEGRDLWRCSCEPFRLPRRYTKGGFCLIMPLLCLVCGAVPAHCSGYPRGTQKAP